MLLDEPFSSLDEITRNAAQDLFLMLWRKYKPTTLLVTHSVDEALKLGHSIFILKNGIMDRIANPNIDSENAVKKESIKKYIVEKLNIGKESLL
jgi:NitT/TauT family transport system ATP-binding protein